jgi:ATP-dependent Zn protease
MPSVIKKIFLSIVLLFLAVMSWRLFTASPYRSSVIPYSVFLQNLDAHKFQKVSIYMGFDLTSLQATTSDSAKQFVNDVPTDGLPALIKKMLDSGISVEFAKARRFELAEFLFDIVPMLMLFSAVGYIYFLRRKLA